MEMELVVDDWEDAELDDQDGSDSPNTIDTSLNKLFNFDMLSNVTPGITRVKPPDFNALVYIPANPKTEPELVRRTYYYRNDASKSLVLPYKWNYYYCGCTEYDIPRHDDERLVNECTISTIQPNEQVYTVTSFINRRMGHTTSQRWRRTCWDRLRPILEHSWLEFRYLRDKAEQERYFDIHSVINEQGERVPELPVRRGRVANKTVLGLTDEADSQRSKLIKKHASYSSRYNKLVSEQQSTYSVEILLNDIYTQVLELGGVPNGWIRYSTD